MDEKFGIKRHFRGVIVVKCADTHARRLCQLLYSYGLKTIFPKQLHTAAVNILLCSLRLQRPLCGFFLYRIFHHLLCTPMHKGPVQARLPVIIPAGAHFHNRLTLVVRPPGTAGGPRKPRKGILPASRSRGTEYPASCITCPAPRKRSSSRCALHLLGIECHPASLEAGSESPFTLPGTAAGAVSLTAKGRGPLHTGRGPRIFIF